MADKTVSTYVFGYLLCIILTAAAFGLSGIHVLSSHAHYAALALLALLQLAVQSYCFLGLNASPNGRWNLLPYLFTILIVTILAGGSLWIMYNLNYNMVN